MTSLLAKWPILSPGYVVTLAALRFCFSHGTLRLMDRDPEPAERPPKSLVYQLALHKGSRTECISDQDRDL